MSCVCTVKKADVYHQTNMTYEGVELPRCSGCGKLVREEGLLCRKCAKRAKKIKGKSGE